MKKSIFLSFLCGVAFLAGCASASNHSNSQSLSTKELIHDPDLYNGRTLNIKGVLILTSEGTYLFEDCVAASRVDLSKSIILNGKVPPKSFGFDGGWVTVKAEFVHRDPKTVYPYNQLTNIDEVEPSPEEFCPD